jgi:flagellar protein FlaF
MSIARYAATMAATQGPREIELRAFRTVNAMLAGAGEDVSARTRALAKNFELWSLLLADLMEPGNGLPGDLKARIASLALWSRGESDRAITETARSLEPLMAVNRDMIEALEAQARGEAKPRPAAPARPLGLAATA